MPRRNPKSGRKAYPKLGSMEKEPIFQPPASQDAEALPSQSQSSFSSSEEDEIEQMGDEEGEKGKRENTLSLLTKRFIQLIKSKQNYVLDINEATSELGVQKRRIYDITNVLEGIGYIQKTHKNKMKWIGGSMNLESAKEVARLDQQIDHYAARTKQLDDEIMLLTHQLRREAEDRRELNYFLQEDLQDILYNIEGDPASMVVIGATEGGEIMTVEGGIAVRGADGFTMSLSKLVKEGRQDSFSIVK